MSNNGSDQIQRWQSPLQKLRDEWVKGTYSSAIPMGHKSSKQVLQQILASVTELNAEEETRFRARRISTKNYSIAGAEGVAMLLAQNPRLNIRLKRP